MAAQVARAKARARPWRSIIALALALAAAFASYAAGAGIPSLSQAGPHTRTVTIVVGKYKKGAPAELAITYATMLDPNGGGFGTLVQQSAAKV